MKFRFLLAAVLALALFPAAGFAQNFTVVSATIVDPNGLPYSNATIQAQLVPTGTTPTLNGVQVASFSNASANVNGTFSMTLASNAVLSPGGTQWQFTVNEIGIAPPAGTGPQSFVVTITISGASQSITSNLNAVAPKLSNAAASVPGIDGPPLTGLMARYDFPPGDSPSACVDTSGRGNNCVGTVGTSPSVGAAGTGGGLICPSANGATIAPAALNTAKTIALYATINAPMPAGGFEALVWGNGNGTTSNSIGVLLSNNAITFGPETYINTIWLWGNGTQRTVNLQEGLGTFPLIATFDTLDHIYENGVEDSYNMQGTVAGLQTVGQYQFCGGAAGSGAGVSTYAQNITIWNAHFYDHAFSTVERNQWNTWANTQGATRGAPFSYVNSGMPAIMLFGNGDSLMQGNGVNPFFQNWQLNTSYSVHMRGRPGMTTALTAVNLPYFENVNYVPTSTDSLMVYDLGTNDCAASTAAATIVQNQAAQIRNWTQLGGRALAISLISRTGFDSCEQAVTALMRTTLPQIPGVVGLIDWMSDASLGASGASASAVFFQDGIHPSQAGVYNDEQWMAQYGVNGTANGNKSWSTAATYTTGAAAAVATTALTESTNTVTVTFSATPANCQVGNLITIAGVTSSGYNTTAANGFGLGAAAILTRTGTQVTYWDNTTGLSAATVQGTGVCQQEQDADVYAILGGSAAGPIHTLEPCEGRVNQPIFRMITNTNASPWIITPMNSSETINGGTTFTTPVATATNHPVVRLNPIPNAIGTGGCTWQADLQ
jgi:hypothetical protein